MTVIEITDNLQSHFIQAVVLLCMLNSVHDDLMIHDFDQDSHNINMSKKCLLKRKFLDFFALICVTKKNDDSVSATCMKKDALQETVLWIVSNFEVDERILNQLRKLMNTLNSIKSEDMILSVSITEHRLIVELISLFSSSHCIWWRSWDFSQNYKTWHDKDLILSKESSWCQRYFRWVYFSCWITYHRIFHVNIYFSAISEMI